MLSCEWWVVTGERQHNNPIIVVFRHKNNIFFVHNAIRKIYGNVD